MRRYSAGTRIFNIANTVFMLALITVTAYPLFFVLVASFSDPTELSLNPGVLLAPLKPYTLSAYRLVLRNPLILTGFRNTAFVMGVGLVINMVLTVITAYVLSIKNLMLNKPLTFFIIFTMYFSGGMIPSYLNIRDLGMLDSLWALIIPGAINTTNLIIMKTAFQSIPGSLIESAHLDGCSHLRILAHIMVPLSGPTLAVMVLYYGVAHWNSWFSASIYLQDSYKFPLQLVMRNILDATQVNSMLGGVDGDEAARLVELIKYALIVITTFPILVLYPFLQRFFTKGVMIGAIKG